MKSFFRFPRARWSSILTFALKEATILDSSDKLWHTIDLCHWQRMQLLLTESSSPFTPKYNGVYFVENVRWIYAKCGICLHLLVFTDRKIQGFPIVDTLILRPQFVWYFFQLFGCRGRGIRVFVPLSTGKRLFSGIYRSVRHFANFLFACVHRCFPSVKLHVHPGFILEKRHFPLFSTTANAFKSLMITNEKEDVRCSVLF